ncbi:hypothetical protein DFH27DRAFT_524686 [Peziza echinospora]|nr:hypothetical protein DFH27DRAFT_524686 [Peziza echinospora]
MPPQRHQHSQQNDPTNGGRRVRCNCNRRTFPHYVARSTYFRHQQASSAFALSSQGGLPDDDNDEELEQESLMAEDEDNAGRANLNIDENWRWAQNQTDQNNFNIGSNQGWFPPGQLSREGPPEMFRLGGRPADLRDNTNPLSNQFQEPLHQSPAMELQDDNGSLPNDFAEHEAYQGDYSESGQEGDYMHSPMATEADDEQRTDIELSQSPLLDDVNQVYGPNNDEEFLEYPQRYTSSMSPVEDDFDEQLHGINEGYADEEEMRHLNEGDGNEQDIPEIQADLEEEDNVEQAQGFIGDFFDGFDIYDLLEAPGLPVDDHLGLAMPTMRGATARSWDI